MVNIVIIRKHNNVINYYFNTPIMVALKSLYFNIFIRARASVAKTVLRRRRSQLTNNT